MYAARCLIALLVLGAGSSPATEPLPIGRALHDAECLVCHAVTHYTRAERKVDSLDRLRRQVALCRDDVGAEWDEAETDQVVDYLNRVYYKY